jgi:murein L,D-transpeptidase YcbB/YkuD
LNVPSSILRKEILPAIAKNSNYLKHDMEWVGRRVRQRPAKCISSEIHFPNSHIIFMHDTPSKAYLIENKGPLVMVVSG